MLHQIPKSIPLIQIFARKRKGIHAKTIFHAHQTIDILLQYTYIFYARRASRANGIYEHVFLSIHETVKLVIDVVFTIQLIWKEMVYGPERRGHRKNDDVSGTSGRRASKLYPPFDTITCVIIVKITF